MQLKMEKWKVGGIKGKKSGREEANKGRMNKEK